MLLRYGSVVSAVAAHEDGSAGAARVWALLTVSQPGFNRFIRFYTVNNDTGDVAAHALLTTGEQPVVPNASGYTFLATVKSGAAPLPALVSADSSCSRRAVYCSAVAAGLSMFIVVFGYVAGVPVPVHGYGRSRNCSSRVFNGMYVIVSCWSGCVDLLQSWRLTVVSDTELTPLQPSTQLLKGA